MQDIAKKIQQALQRVSGEPIIVASAHYKTKKIEDDMFVPVSAKALASTTLYVDGGNTTIADGTQFHLSYVRVCVVTQEPYKQLIPTVYEFVLFLAKVPQSSNYSIDIVPQNPLSEKLYVDASMEQVFLKDCSLDEFTGERDCTTLVNHIRRCLEIFIATHSANALVLLKKSCLVVLDGSLKSVVATTVDYLEQLYKSGASVCALSKTTNLSLISGQSVTSFLLKKEGMWYLDRAISSLTAQHKALLTFVKLHPKATHVFRLDIARSSNLSADEIVGHLATTSIDSSFYGYPYPLIRADSHARVTEQEKTLFTTQLFGLLDKELITALQDDATSMNAHSILDKMKF